MRSVARYPKPSGPATRRPISCPVKRAGSLKRNVAISNLDKFVTVHELALGDAETEVPFTIGKDTRNQVARAGEKNFFFANIKKVLTPDIQFDVIERDFQAVDFKNIGCPPR